MYKRLRDLREDNDFTQTQVAEYLYVKQNTYAQYERGRRNIPTELLIKLSDLYGVSIEYILGRTNNPNLYR